VADNTPLVANAAINVATDEATYSGQTAQFQINRLVHVSGSEGSKTVTEVVTPAGSPASVALTVHGPTVLKHPIMLAATTNAVRIKSGATVLKSVHANSVRASSFFIKIHDSNTNPPVAGSTAVAFPIQVQAGAPRDIVFPDGGIALASGFGVTVVTGLADADATAVAAGDGSLVFCYV